MSVFSWMNPGGGIRYHGRALFNRHSRWTAFRQEIAAWLETWIPRHEASREALTLIAPSGGHCLPRPWLESFRSLTAIDIDPTARFFFQRNHPACSAHLHWIQGNIFERWNDLLMKNPEAKILFCNFLGQAQACDPVRAESWFKRLRSDLDKRSWASFHDRYSGELKMKPHVGALPVSARARPETLLEHFYPASTRGELCEHELPQIFPENGNYLYCRWQLDPCSTHLIEAYSSSPPPL
jgi:hypothetical protein